MSDEFEKVEKKLLDAEAEKKALNAVLDGEKTAPDGVDPKLFNRYKEHPPENPAKVRDDLQTTVAALEQQKATLMEKVTLADEEGLPKKRNKLDGKAVSAVFIEKLDAGKIGEAVSHLKTVMLKEDFSRPDPAHFCDPYTIEETFGERELQEVLVENAAELDRTADTKAKKEKKERLLGLRLGTGFGKTHVLMKAPELLGCTASAYLTYSQGQVTTDDERFPQKAILLRVVLRLCNIANVECPHFFAKYSSLLESPDLSESRLFDLVYHLLQDVYLPQNTPRSFFIGIDEIRLMCTINPEHTKAATSAVGNLVVYLNTKGITTTVLVTALSDSTFRTISSRPIREIFLPRDASAHSFVRSRALAEDRQSKRNCSLLESLCGFHFRSIVVACEELNKGPKEANWDIFQLYKKTMPGLRFKMAREDVAAVLKFVKKTLKEGVTTAEADIAAAIPFTDACGAVPPIIVYHCFNKQDNFEEYEHPVQKLFEVSAFVDPPKQLELCGYHFDRFRALYGLPVVTHGMSVANAAGHQNWFKELTLSQATCLDDNKCGDNLLNSAKKFKCKNKECNTTVSNQQSKVCTSCGGELQHTTTTVVRSATMPVAGKYYLPSNPSHPWIDRAVVATHRSSGEDCLVLYQDNINSDSFPEAVEKLNKAGDLFAKDFKRILCIAHVVGATVSTHKQKDFRHPYLLIREPEIALIYSKTLAPAIAFVRARHNTLKK